MTIYDTCSDFVVVSEDSQVYKNIYETNFTSDFEHTSNPVEYLLTQADIDRIDILMLRLYGKPQFDDFILNINNKSSVYELIVGEVILLPSFYDLNTYYNKRLK